MVEQTIDSILGTMDITLILEHLMAAMFAVVIISALLHWLLGRAEDRLFAAMLEQIERLEQLDPALAAAQLDRLIEKLETHERRYVGLGELFDGWLRQPWLW